MSEFTKARPLTNDEINKKLTNPLDPKVFREKRQLNCIRDIALRFDKYYSIRILDHIIVITKVGYTFEHGFSYWPLDTKKWLETLKATKKFVPDEKNNLVGCLASAATTGLGIRELGTDMSLHCAVANSVCSIHLDKTAFRIRGPYGFMFSLDGGQHVLFDLLWDDLIVKWVYGKSYATGFILDYIRPNFLTSKTGYSKYGLGIDIYDKPNLKIKFDYSRSFSIGKNLNKEFYKGFLNTKEHELMLTLEKRFSWF